MSILRFTVNGEPIPQGSMRAFMPPNGKFPILTSDNARLKPWRKLLTQCAGLAMRKADFIQCGKRIPIRITADFYFEKPKSQKGMIDKVTRPDLDKCCRSLMDSMTGVVYEDDSQVTEIIVRKLFGSPARVEVQVEEADFPAETTLPLSPMLRDSEMVF